MKRLFLQWEGWVANPCRGRYREAVCVSIARVEVKARQTQKRANWRGHEDNPRGRASPPLSFRIDTYRYEQLALHPHCYIFYWKTYRVMLALQLHFPSLSKAPYNLPKVNNAKTSITISSNFVTVSNSKSSQGIAEIQETKMSKIYVREWPNGRCRTKDVFHLLRRYEIPTLPQRRCGSCSDGNESFGLIFFSGALTLGTKSNSYNKKNYVMNIVRVWFSL